MKKLFLTLLTSSSLLFGFAQEATVFKSGADGYASYRIPAIIQTKAGHLMAIAEGRVDHAGDYGNVDIVFKISKDEGKTWGPLQKAVDYEKLQAGNPAPVVDLLDPQYPQGRIFLFYNTGNNHEGEVRKGKGLREVWYISSTDAGVKLVGTTEYYRWWCTDRISLTSTQPTSLPKTGAPTPIPQAMPFNLLAGQTRADSTLRPTTVPEHPIRMARLAGPCLLQRRSRQDLPAK